MNWINFPTFLIYFNVVIFHKKNFLSIILYTHNKKTIIVKPHNRSFTLFCFTIILQTKYCAKRFPANKTITSNPTTCFRNNLSLKLQPHNFALIAPLDSLSNQLNPTLAPCLISPFSFQFQLPHYVQSTRIYYTAAKNRRKSWPTWLTPEWKPLT